MIEVRMLTLREIREQKDISQIDLAYLSGIGITTISKMERGIPVSKKSFERVCEKLSVDPKEVSGVNVKRTFRRGA